MRADSALEARLWLAAALCFVLFFTLGAFVSSRPPTKIDLLGGALRGEFIPVAAFFTGLGRTFPILWIGLAALAIAALARASIVSVLVVLASQVLSQGAVSAVKPLYHRLRPDHWLLYRERDFSFPSGHATTSIVYFGALALLAWRSPLPRPLALALTSAAAVGVVGIPWSRLALGAHYVTDVAGGLLFGTGWLCVATALALRAGIFAF